MCCQSLKRAEGVIDAGDIVRVEAENRFLLPCDAQRDRCRHLMPKGPRDDSAVARQNLRTRLNRQHLSMPIDAAFRNGNKNRPAEKQQQFDGRSCLPGRTFAVRRTVVPLYVVQRQGVQASAETQVNQDRGRRDLTNCTPRSRQAAKSFPADSSLPTFPECGMISAEGEDQSFEAAPDGLPGSFVYSTQ
jgi:hypothetical protein